MAQHDGIASLWLRGYRRKARAGLPAMAQKKVQVRAMLLQFRKGSEIKTMHGVALPMYSCTAGTRRSLGGSISISNFVDAESMSKRVHGVFFVSSQGASMCTQLHYASTCEEYYIDCCRQAAPETCVTTVTLGVALKGCSRA